MNDKEKLLEAKKNYAAFVSKLGTVSTPISLQATTIVMKNNKTIKSEYWNEHDISPTRFYYWLRQQQKYNLVEQVVLDEKLFNQLTSMLCDVEYVKSALSNIVSFKFDNVLITTSRLY